MAAPRASFRPGSPGSIAPDGRRLAFISTSGDHDLLLATGLNPVEPRQLASVPKGGVSGVDWSRDSTYLLVSTPTKPVGGLWKVSFEGGQPERLPIEIERQ